MGGPRSWITGPKTALHSDLLCVKLQDWARLILRAGGATEAAGWVWEGVGGEMRFPLAAGALRLHGEQPTGSREGPWSCAWLWGSDPGAASPHFIWLTQIVTGRPLEMSPPHPRASLSPGSI